MNGFASLVAGAIGSCIQAQAAGPANCGPNALIASNGSYIVSGQKFNAILASNGSGMTGATCHSVLAGTLSVFASGRCFSVTLGQNTSGLGAASNTTSVYGISKTGGSFRIKHPDPSKPDKHLIHSFVESPTAGDNIYKYRVKVQGGKASLELPSYYKFLNCNDHVHISPTNHFGKGYGVMDQQQTKIDFVADTDGEYDVILIGTRKDYVVQNNWKGVERLKNPD